MTGGVPWFVALSEYIRRLPRGYYSDRAIRERRSAAKVCICPSHASNCDECPVHDKYGRVRLQNLGGGDDPRVRPSDSRAESQAGLTGPSGSLNPSPKRATLDELQAAVAAYLAAGTTATYDRMVAALYASGFEHGQESETPPFGLSGRMEQDEFNSRMDAGEDPYSIVADDMARSRAANSQSEPQP